MGNKKIIQTIGGYGKRRPIRMYRLSRTQTILNQNDAVNVILHNDKHIELGVRVVIGYGVPAIDGNFPRCRKH
jgi:hypothetical protein